MNPDRWNPSFATRGIGGGRRNRSWRDFDGPAPPEAGPHRQNSRPTPERGPDARSAPDSVSNSLRRMTTRGFSPLIGPVLRNRTLCALLLAAWLVQVGWVFCGLNGWSCPLRGALNLPCPGCGLTRATVCLLQGQIRMALDFHLLSPAVLATAILLVIGAVRANPLYQWVLESLESMERRIPFTGIVLTGFLLHWAFTLVAGPEAGIPG